MTDAPLIGTVTRAEYLAAARALLDLAAVERLEFDLPCENPSHDDGTLGCVPGTPAAHVWRRLANGCENGRPPHVLLCDGMSTWLRENADRVARCRYCGERRPFREVVEYVAPLSRVSDTLAP